jgi:hypothetical protein
MLPPIKSDVRGNCPRIVRVLPAAAIENPRVGHSIQSFASLNLHDEDGRGFGVRTLDSYNCLW